MLGPEYTDFVLTTNLVATLYMTGLIWFVQLVHYPLMASVGEDRYVNYQTAHMSRTTWAVGPAMLMEAGSALALVLCLPPGTQLALAWRAFALLVVIWIATAIFSVPAHQKLLSAFNPKAHRHLVLTNWVRTIGWTARAIIVVCIFHYHHAQG